MPGDMRRQATRTAAFAALGLGLAAGAVEARVVELGLTSPRPAASCPRTCQAVGQVTGFQARQSSARNPFRIKRRGKIVAFSITLSKPTREQRRFFTRLFGGSPRARLAILRPGVKRRHRLTGQSEVFNLSPYLGSTPTFVLSRPLTVRKGYVVGLTVPTWAPAFAVGLGNAEAWRSSRSADNCNDVRQRAAQERRGSLRTYGCFYRTARLLYTAVFVPDPRKTSRRSRVG